MTSTFTPEISANRLFYEENGYIVFRNEFDAAQIDNLIGLYEGHVLSSKDKFYRQNTFSYEKNKINEHGHSLTSFLNVHDYENYPDFQSALLDLYFDPTLLEHIAEANGYAEHNLIQSMLFDHNTATWPHTDNWYLDSRRPGGKLVGAWIALETIHEDAGHFYVVPRSHLTPMHDKELKMSHEEFVKNCGEFLEAESTEIYAPALNKGDVLLWSSCTVHGSTETRDHSYSRRSLTAHYNPSELPHGNLFVEKPWLEKENKEWHGRKYCSGQAPAYSLRNNLIAETKKWIYNKPKLLKLARRFQNKGIYS